VPTLGGSDDSCATHDVSHGFLLRPTCCALFIVGLVAPGCRCGLAASRRGTTDAAPVHDLRVEHVLQRVAGGFGRARGRRRGTRVCRLNGAVVARVLTTRIDVVLAVVVVIVAGCFVGVGWCGVRASALEAPRVAGFVPVG
jgi:hypothetical protein